MDVARLDLSKELYELSGWNDTRDIWRHHLPRPDLSMVIPREVQEADDERFRINTEPNRLYREQNKIYSAYDLGYLLRKLPPAIKNSKYTSHLFVDAMDAPGAWRFGYKTSPDVRLRHHLSTGGDTPEDAVCKLAIDLFKQGVLKKDV